MKKLLFLILSIGLIGQLKAGYLSTQDTEDTEALQQTIKTHQQKLQEINDAKEKKNNDLMQARTKAQNEFRDNLKQAGLYIPGNSLIESNLTCNSKDSSNSKPQSIPLTSGFALSFCSSSNVDFAKVNKIGLLRLLADKMQENQ